MPTCLKTFAVWLVWGGLLASGQQFYGGGVTAATTARGGIYLATPDGVSDAMALNPAGLSALRGPTLNLTLNLISASGSFSNAVNSDSPMRPNRGLAPFGAFGTPLGHSRWSVGVGVAPDLTSSAKWQYRDAVYGLQNEKSAIIALRATAGVAYAFSRRLSAGASVGADYNSNTLEGPYIFQSNPALQGLKTLLDLKTDGFGWNVSLGVRGKLTRGLEWNAAWRSKTSITSKGRATGNLGAQFAALGLAFQPDFVYDAKVKVVAPQSALFSASWQASQHTRLSAQADWIGWKSAFHDLPVTLTNGSNADINALLKSNGIFDVVPLLWKDQYSFRAGVERSLTERVSVSAGYVHSNNPVPGSTLSPLTAAIMQDGLSVGLGASRGRARFDLGYGFHFNNSGYSGRSALQAGEFSNSKVVIGTQILTFTTTFGL